jgi:squalene-hopene/tetraprenyl-beta-curcumene cyclase
MKAHQIFILGAALCALPATAADDAAKVKASLKEGAEFLISKQGDDGSWGGQYAKHPAITALCVMAIHQVDGVDEAKREAAIKKAMPYVLSFIQDDGSIFPADRDQKQSANYPNYTTSIALLCMATLDRPEYLPQMRAARRFIQNNQFSDKSKVDFGGLGYGKTGRADLSNASWAAEALYYTDYLDREPFSAGSDPQAMKRTKAMWTNLQTFLTKCQNLPETNTENYASKDPRDKGGFIYRPNESKAGTRNPDDVSGLISSGSMTYAGMKTMIYAKLDKNDVRVKGAMHYLSNNYTLTENPEMGMQGYYYYLHAMAKALDVYGTDTFASADGIKHDWRKEVTDVHLKLQREDGSWANTHSRYFESMPELATSYSMVTLKVANRMNDLKRK